MVRGIVGIVLVVVFLFLSPFVIINAGHRGVVMNVGKVQDTVLGEGMHWRTPLVQSVKEIDVRSTKTESTISAYSKDTQTVDMLIAVNYHLDADRVNSLYQDVGMEYETKILIPVINEEFKTAVAAYNANELLSNRPTLRETVLVKVRERVASRHIVIEDVAIQNFDFSDQYEQAIEAKQVAEQTALKAENDLKRVEFEADQRVEQAKAEAEAIRIQAEAITQQGGEDYVKLKWIEKWNGTLPQTSLGEAVPLINI